MFSWRLTHPTSVMNFGIAIRIQLRDYSGSWGKWCPPTIANGKVYLATFDNLLNVYGVLSSTSGSGGSLLASNTTSAGAVNLTTEGSADWEHWGEGTPNHKAGCDVTD